MGSAPLKGETKVRHTGRRVVLTTFGSLGDLYPYLAVAKGLQARGHEVVIATTRHYQQLIEERGIGFHAVRPDGPNLNTDGDVMRRIMDARTGGQYLIRDLLMPVLRDSYEDVLSAADGADLLVAHVLAYATRLAAEKKSIPWVSSFLQPLGFFSAHDPPVLPRVPYLTKLRFIGPVFHRALFWVAKRNCRSWGQMWHHFRAEIGLPPTSENPIVEGLYSPSLVLAMFSREFADKQPDWPLQAVVTGFPFTSQVVETGMPPDLSRFLDAGPPPIVFTPGSPSVLNAGPFFEHSAVAAALLGRRAILVTGNYPVSRLGSLPDGVVAFGHVPFPELFPRAAVIVGAGGIGTVSQAMRAGRPMLVAPYAHDQFDNAARVTRLGIARTVSQRGYVATHVATELQHLLDNKAYSARALCIGERIRRENGVGAACDALEEQLRASRLRE